jgi:hypothetical protein
LCSRRVNLSCSHDGGSPTASASSISCMRSRIRFGLRAQEYRLVVPQNACNVRILGGKRELAVASAEIRFPERSTSTSRGGLLGQGYSSTDGPHPGRHCAPPGGGTLGQGTV